MGATGSFISEEDQILTIFNGLNERYNPVMLNIQETRISLTETMQNLLSHESRIERRNIPIQYISCINFTSDVIVSDTVNNKLAMENVI